LPERCAVTLGEIGKEFPKVDVELHKFCSDQQTNVSVRCGVKADFDELPGPFRPDERRT
jgi:hypothetical protein